MARPATLLQLRTDARLYADERPDAADSFITIVEANRLVNQELAELYDLLVAARGQEYQANTATVIVSATTGLGALPADFYQLLEATIAWSADDVEFLGPFERPERWTYVNFASWGRHAPKAYRLIAGNISIIPTPTSSLSLSIAYIPPFADLTTDASTFDGVNGWEDAVTLGVAAKMRILQQQDASQLLLLKDRAVERIRAMVTERDAGMPKRVTDVYPEGILGHNWFGSLPRP